MCVHKRPRLGFVSLCLKLEMGKESKADLGLVQLELREGEAGQKAAEGMQESKTAGQMWEVPQVEDPGRKMAVALPVPHQAPVARLRYPWVPERLGVRLGAVEPREALVPQGQTQGEARRGVA
jgi:hypothetical protein